MTKLRTITDLQAQLTAANQIAIVDGERIRYVDRAASWANALALVENIDKKFSEYITLLKSAGVYVEEVRE